MRGFLITRVLVPALAIVFSCSSINTPALASYVFTSHTFTNCGALGKTGPTQTACRSSYSTSWDESDANFTVTNGIQNWTVPTTGYYYIDAYGAGGYGAYAGGGARIADTFLLTEGEVIKILVGQIGETSTFVSANSGAGGTFVVRTPYNTNGSILVIAGGGAGSESGSSQHAEAHASITTSGNNGYATGGGAPSATTSGSGGTGGNGGGTAASENAGGGGGGFFTDGTRNTNWDNNGGVAFVTGGAGATGGTTYANSNDGGFGGGGGDNIGNGSGGGGGSYFANGRNTNRITTVNGNPAQTQGFVTITFLSASTSTATLTVAGNVTKAEFNKSISLTTDISNPGKVTFFENNRKIPSCIAISATTSATCNWKPKIRGSVKVKAILTPTDNSLTSATSPFLSIDIVSRTTAR